MKSHVVPRSAKVPDLRAAWESPDWAQVPELRVDSFLDRAVAPKDSGFRPDVRAKLQYDRDGVYVLFQVHDQYVRALETHYQGLVCFDSCVEIFVQPKPDAGYVNFEMNCAGCLLLFHVTDYRPGTPPRFFREYLEIPQADGDLARRYPTLPAVVDPEITTPVTWRLGLHIPVRLLEKYVGPIGDPAGQVWRGNLFKCADHTSHPHWASWNPVTAFNFHLPPCFGELRFA